MHGIEKILLQFIPPLVIKLNILPGLQSNLSGPFLNNWCEL